MASIRFAFQAYCRVLNLLLENKGALNGFPAPLKSAPYISDNDIFIDRLERLPCL